MDGMVYLVGAGPGDPDLITVKGLQCLARADVLISDYLVNPALLLSRSRARRSSSCRITRARRRKRRLSTG